MKRVLSVLLSIVLVVGLCPAPAFAAGGAVSAGSASKLAAQSAGAASSIVQAKAKGKTVKGKKATVYCNSATQGTAKLTAKGLKAAKATWKSSKPKIASVKKGTVTAKKAGKAVVTAKQGKTTFTFDVVVKNVSINKTKASVVVKKTVALKLTGDKIKSVKTSNKKVATVSKKGVVKGVKAGTATITLTSKKNKKFTCKVTVKTPTVAVTGVSFKNKSLKLGYGETKSWPAKVSPNNATNKTVTYISSDTSVATVDRSGKITPKKLGTTKITAKAGKKTATCTVTVVKGTTTATTAKALAKALDNGALYETITYKSNAKESITLDSDADLSGTDLVINAPNASIANKNEYHSVTIQAIAADTYTEHARNDIKVDAEKSHIVIAEEAVATVSAESKVKSLQLDNSGTVDKLEVKTKGKIDIKQSEDNLQAKIDTVVRAAATIAANVTLDVNVKAEVVVSLVLSPGSEGTTVEVKSSTYLPIVVGIGIVVATIVDSDGNASDKEQVVAGYSDAVAKSDDVVEIAELAGTVVDLEGDPVEGADVAMYHFGASQAAQPIQTAKTASDGSYVLKSVKAGNYSLVVTKEGYKKTRQTIYVGNAEGNRALPVTYLSSEGAEDAEGGTISGRVIDATQQGSVPIEGISVRLRSGAGDVTGEILAKATTGEDGSFYFGEDEKLAAGVYTIEAIDVRSYADVPYLSTHETVTVRGGKETTQTIGMTQGVDRGKLQFILHWDDEDDAGVVPADIDSHLYGPRVDGGLFHTLYSDMSYAHDGNTIAFLDRDDTSFEGPETTTVHQLSQGTYTFFVHDYTNLWKTYSTALGNSGAYVEVFAGSAKQTFYVPKGAAGTVWAVCSYDPVTRKITPIDEMSYESDPWLVGSDYLYGGLRIVDIEENDFVKRADYTSSRVELSVSSMDIDGNLGKIKVTASDGGTAQVMKADDGESYLLKLTSADGSKVRYYGLNFRLDYGDLEVTDVELNDVITYASISDDWIHLTATDTSFEAIKANLHPIFGKEGVTFSFEDGDGYYDDDEYYGDGWLLKITDGELTRVYRVDASPDWGGLAITRVIPNGSILYGYVYNDSVELCVSTDDFETYKNDLSLEFAREGISLVGMTREYDEEEDFYDDPVITIRDDATGATRQYDAEIEYDYSPMLTGFNLNDVVTGYDIDQESRYVTLYATDTDVDAWMAGLEPVVANGGIGEFIVDKYDEGDGYSYCEIRLATYSDEYQLIYDVNVVKDWQGLELTDVVGNAVVTSRQISDSAVYLGVRDESFDVWSEGLKFMAGDFELEGSFAYDEDGRLELTLNHDGQSRVYSVYVSYDWQGLEVSPRADEDGYALVWVNDGGREYTSSVNISRSAVGLDSGEIDDLLGELISYGDGVASHEVVNRDGWWLLRLVAENGDMREYQLDFSPNGPVIDWIDVAVPEGEDEWRGLSVSAGPSRDAYGADFIAVDVRRSWEEGEEDAPKQLVCPPVDALKDVLEMQFSEEGSTIGYWSEEDGRWVYTVTTSDPEEYGGASTREYYLKVTDWVSDVLDHVATDGFVDSVEDDWTWSVRLNVLSQVTPDKARQIQAYDKNGNVGAVVYASGSYYLDFDGGDGTTVRRYDLQFERVWGDFAVTGVASKGVVTAGEVWDGAIRLYVTDGDFEAYRNDVVATFAGDGLSATVERDEQWDEDGTPYVYLAVTDGSEVRTYTLDVVVDSTPRAAAFELNSVVTGYRISQEDRYVQLSATDTSFAAWSEGLGVVCGPEGATGFFEEYDSGDEDYGVRLVVRCGDEEASYDVAVDKDWQDLEVVGWQPVDGVSVFPGEYDLDGDYQPLYIAPSSEGVGEEASLDDVLNPAFGSAVVSHTWEIVRKEDEVSYRLLRLVSADGAFHDYRVLMTSHNEPYINYVDISEDWDDVGWSAYDTRDGISGKSYIMVSLWKCYDDESADEAKMPPVEEVVRALQFDLDDDFYGEFSQRDEEWVYVVRTDNEEEYSVLERTYYVKVLYAE